MDHYLSVAEVAEMLNVSTATVKRHIVSHQLPALKVGRVYRVKYDDVRTTYALSAKT